MTSSSRGGTVRSIGRDEPFGEFLLARGGDPEPLLRPLGVPGVRLDEPIPLKALKGRVHLADVEGPDVTGLLLELLPELVAILRSLA